MTVAQQLLLERDRYDDVMRPLQFRMTGIDIARHAFAADIAAMESLTSKRDRFDGNEK